VWTAAAAIALAAAAPAGASELALIAANGSSVRWSEWVAANGPAAVLVWASWAPGAPAAVDGLPELATEARSQGLKLVVVDVQEELEAARRGLERAGVAWLHDRHGAILKQYRLIQLPILLVVDQDGRELARMAPSAESLQRLER
jgi:thiol-disulfide isomerase/thioredoxin